MKKIVFIRPGDIYVTPAFSRIIESLDLKNDQSVKLIVLQWLDDEPLKNEEGIEYINFEKKRNALTFIRWNFFLLYHLFNRRPSFVHNFSFHSWLPILTYSLLYPKRIRLFYDCRDYFGWSFKLNPLTKRISIWCDRIIAKMCKRIIFPDPNGFVYFNSTQEKYLVVPNTVTDYFENKDIIRDITGTRIKLFYAGYLSLDRNIEAIIKAVKRYNHLELHIASNFISNQFNNELLHDPRFVYHGRLSHAEVIEVMLKSDYCLIMYNANLENYKLIQPTKFYDSLMTNTPFICAEGMDALKEYCGAQWPNLCLPYGDETVFDSLTKPNIGNNNRLLYENNYKYNMVLSSIGKIYSEFLN